MLRLAVTFQVAGSYRLRLTWDYWSIAVDVVVTINGLIRHRSRTPLQTNVSTATSIAPLSPGFALSNPSSASAQQQGGSGDHTVTNRHSSTDPR